MIDLSTFLSWLSRHFFYIFYINFYPRHARAEINVEKSRKKISTNIEKVKSWQIIDKGIVALYM